MLLRYESLFLCGSVVGKVVRISYSSKFLENSLYVGAREGYMLLEYVKDLCC